MKLSKLLSDLHTRHPGAMPKFVKRVLRGGLSVSSRWRVLPDFIILGTPKSGTTTLFANLALHPDVLPSLIKETYYLHGKNYHGLERYRMFFPLKRFLTGGDMVTGEASTTYYYDQTVSDLLLNEASLSQVKLLVVFREPAKRAISQYWHFVRHGRESHSFDTVFQHMFDLYEGRTAGQAFPTVDSGQSDSDYLKCSFYDEFLDHWMPFIDQGRLKVIFFDDLVERPVDVMTDVQGWLGLSPFTSNADEKFNVNTGRPKGDDEDVLIRLRELFRPDMIRLAKKLDLPQSWLTEMKRD